MNVYSFQPHTRRFIQLVFAGEHIAADALLPDHPYILTDRNASKETALHWLAVENEADGVRILLRHGADPNTVDHGGNSPLVDAATQGLVDVVRALLDHGVNVHHAHYHSRGTVLHAAARQSPDPEVIDLLVRAGAEVEARDHMESTPLLEAASFGNGPTLLRLLANGADPQATDGFGRMALHELVDEVDDVALVDALIDAGAPLDAVNETGDTALSRAEQKGFVNVVQRLLDRGADATLAARSKQALYESGACPFPELEDDAQTDGLDESGESK